MTKLWSRSESSGRALRGAVCDCLDQLGHSPDDVAGRLELYGVQGSPGRADDCPMARYLWAVIGTEKTVGRIGVLEQRMRITRKGLRLPVSIPLPPSVQAFVREFDEGSYPALVDTAKPARRFWGNGPAVENPAPEHPAPEHPNT